MQNLATRMNDEQLVTAFATGDNKAFDTLLKRHQNRIFTYILSIVKNSDVADDIFQETFIKVITRIKENRYTESGKFAAWVQRIAHNLIIDHFRQTKSEAQVSTDSETGGDILNNADLSEESIEDLLISAQNTRDIRRLIRALPATQRQVLVMRYYRNMSFKEIAELTGVSINTALGRMRYALMNIRRLASEHNIALAM